MSVTPQWAPYVPTYASSEPYITVEEFLAAPTGTDLTQLVPGGDPQTNRDALWGVIQRASSEADLVTRQVLAATIDVQTSPPDGWRAQLRGSRVVLEVATAFTPIVNVQSVTIADDTNPTQVTPLPDLSGIRLGRKIVTIPVNARMGTRFWGEVTYTNGWFNSALNMDADAGDAVITPADVLGLYSGLQFQVYDTMFSLSEVCQVAASYVPGSPVVPLTAPLRASHAAGTACSSLPAAVRQAVISLTSSLIKRRGGEAIMLSSMNDQPMRVEQGEPGMTADEQLARRLLQPFMRVR